MAEITLEGLDKRIAALEKQPAPEAFDNSLNEQRFDDLEEQINTNAKTANEAAEAKGAPVKKKPITVTQGKKTYTAKVEIIKYVGDDGLVTVNLREASDSEILKLAKGKFKHKFSEA